MAEGARPDEAGAATGACCARCGLNRGARPPPFPIAAAGCVRSWARRHVLLAGREDTIMSGNFRVVALPRERFLPLFALDDDALRERSIRRSVVTESPGTPCRVSLEDAAPGERVLLLPFTHHDVASPYRASGPIYVREAAKTAQLLPGEVPP